MLRLSLAPHHFCLLKWKMILRSNLSLVTFQFIGINFSSVIWDAFFLFHSSSPRLLSTTFNLFSFRAKKKKLTNFHIPALKAETSMPHACASYQIPATWAFSIMPIKLSCRFSSFLLLSFLFLFSILFAHHRQHFIASVKHESST